MIETPRLWPVFGVLFAAACAAPEPQVAEAPPPAPVAAPPLPAPDPAIAQAKLAEQAKALLAQAETDIQRARAKRALWLPAWAELLAARESMASRDAGGTVVHAQRASDFAQLGLEQLAYPAVTAAGAETNRK